MIVNCTVIGDGARVGDCGAVGDEAGRVVNDACAVASIGYCDGAARVVVDEVVIADADAYSIRYCDGAVVVDNTINLVIET